MAPVPLNIKDGGELADWENFYADRNRIQQAVAAGTLPSPPARDLCLIIKSAKPREELGSFLKWVLTDGQPYVAECGFVPLPATRLTEELKKLEL